MKALVHSNTAVFTYELQTISRPDYNNDCLFTRGVLTYWKYSFGLSEWWRLGKS